MAWPPGDHIQVFDERSIKKNIIVFLKASQVDALYWANDDAAGLDPIVAFHKTARLVSRFPAVTFLQQQYSTAFGNGDIGVIVYSMTLELAITHGKQDELSDMAPKYAMALESMLANIPETTLNEASIIPITSTLQGLETIFDVQDKIKNRFIQVSQTKVSWVIDLAIPNT